MKDGAIAYANAYGYTRYALGPNRLGPKEGKGWLYAAGELAMTASDLARWDIAVINRTLMTPASYKTQQTATILNDGTPSNYALGVGVGKFNDHRYVAHSGGVSGFTTQNIIFPDDRAAVVVLTNTDATPASGQIQAMLMKRLFAAAMDAPTEQAVAQMKSILAGLPDAVRAGLPPWPPQRSSSHLPDTDQSNMYDHLDGTHLDRFVRARNGVYERPLWQRARTALWH